MNMRSTEFVSKIYRLDFMPIINEPFDQFHALIETTQKRSESLKSFESRFSAAFTEFNSLSKTTKLSQLATSLLFLADAQIDQSQSVPALAATKLSGTVFCEHSSKEYLLIVVIYSQVASVVKKSVGSDSSCLSA